MRIGNGPLDATSIGGRVCMRVSASTCACVRVHNELCVYWRGLFSQTAVDIAPSFCARLPRKDFGQIPGSFSIDYTSQAASMSIIPTIYIVGINLYLGDEKRTRSVSITYTYNTY